MGVTRLNHAVLYVRDLTRSQAFYEEVLGFRALARLGDQAVFLQAPQSTNDHDLALFQVGASAAASNAGAGGVGLYHLSWEVDTLGEMARIRGLLSERGSLVGASDHATTKALYAKDPDGIELEVTWVVPAALLTDDLRRRQVQIAPLDLDAEIAHYGADTVGGIGISIPTGAGPAR